MPEKFTKEVLKAQDGKKVPLTLKNGGPAIGEATLRYDPDTGALIADMKVDDIQVAKVFGQEASAIIFERES